jgi:hypothetical protein
VTNALRQPSFSRVILVLAATVVVLVGIRLGSARRLDAATEANLETLGYAINE